jgi:hypothetical protein
MEAIYFFSAFGAIIAILTGCIIYSRFLIANWKLKLLQRHEQGVFYAYVVSYAMVAFVLGFIPNGLVLAAIWLALAAVQFWFSYLVAKKWGMKVSFWVTVAFHVLQVVALLIYLI